MTLPAPQPTRAVESFGEKQFYLDEFRGRTLLFALSAEDLAEDSDLQSLAVLVGELIRNETRVIVLVGAAPARAADRMRRYLQRRFGALVFNEDFPTRLSRRGLRSIVFQELSPRGFAAESDAAVSLSRFWSVLRDVPLFVGVVAGASRAQTFLFAQQAATRLQVHKLLFMEPAGGLAGADGKRLSFLDEGMLSALLETGQAEWSGLAGRRESVEIVRAAVRGGVTSVNLCSVAGAARELFTYEGSGTLFTLADYCTVARLGIDDFEEVERLIERGHREGLLKERTDEEVGAMLLAGYGAKIGDHHLAGICALITDPYRKQGAGEIVGLYTITRFKGEGVGVRLVDRVVADARAAGLAYVFATTTVERAMSFFERRGFRRVARRDVPAVKWRGYDPRRRRRVVALRIDLDATPEKQRWPRKKPDTRETT
jgi:N-acetylglutamate synthase-like GNAT family acetyltransferase